MSIFLERGGKKKSGRSKESGWGRAKLALFNTWTHEFIDPRIRGGEWEEEKQNFSRNSKHKKVDKPSYDKVPGGRRKFIEYRR